MIKKTLTLTALLVVVYSFLVSRDAAWWSATQHQWQGNTIKAEKFIYGNNAGLDNVIVGSSLACRIVTDSIPNTYNLAFNGLSIFDGLHILQQCDTIPHRVFIEMNVVLRAEDPAFVSSLFSVLYYPKKFIPALRSDKQPLGIVGDKIKDETTKDAIDFFKPIIFTKKTNKKNASKNDLFSKMLELKTSDYSKKPNNAQLNNVFEKLKNYVDNLEKRNIKVVFFEMPVNPKLIHLALAKTVRETFYKTFPTSKYQYIPLPSNTTDYNTSDGLHLTTKEAKQYTIYFRNSMLVTSKNKTDISPL